MTEEPKDALMAPGDAAPAEDEAARQVNAERVAEIIRTHLRNSPVSQSTEAWNFLQSQLGAIAADILKEP